VGKAGGCENIRWRLEGMLDDCDDDAEPPAIDDLSELCELMLGLLNEIERLKGYD